jgi:hypothetical protein
MVKEKKNYKKKTCKINFDNLLKQKANENNKGLGKGVGEPA